MTKEQGLFLSTSESYKKDLVPVPSVLLRFCASFFGWGGGGQFIVVNLLYGIVRSMKRVNISFLKN